MNISTFVQSPTLHQSIDVDVHVCVAMRFKIAQTHVNMNLCEYAQTHIYT